MSLKIKNNIFCLVAFCNVFAACNGSKKSVSTGINNEKLAGKWELNYINNSGIACDELYPDKKPTINFDITNNQISGNTSCNNFNGSITLDHNKISITDPMAMTKMMCFNINGENVFLETLNKINTWSVTDNSTLNLIMGDIVMMRFVKK